MKTHNLEKIFSGLLLCSLAFAGLTACNQTPVNFQKQLQEQLIKAKAGDVIEVPEGKFQLDRTLSLSSDKVTIRDLQATILRAMGMDPYKLSYLYQGLHQRLIGPTNDAVVQEALLV